MTVFEAGLYVMIYVISKMDIFLECNWTTCSQVNYINAHATSTLVGDLAEINAVKKVFKNTSGIKINATKVIFLSLSLILVRTSILFQTLDQIIQGCCILGAIC